MSLRDIPPHPAHAYVPQSHLLTGRDPSLQSWPLSNPLKTSVSRVPMKNNFYVQC